MKAMFLIGLLGVALAGCSKKDNDEAKPAETPTATKPAEDKPVAADETKPAAADDTKPAADETAAADLGNWESFFGEFQKAAAAKDGKALAELTQIGEEIDQGTFDMLSDTFMTQEVLDALAKAEPSSIKPKDEDGTEVYEFSWSETAMVDGEEMGSALFFYFKKVDGKFKLFRLLAAG